MALPKQFIKNNRVAYISHDICDEMKAYDNVYFLSNLNQNIDNNKILNAIHLPFKDEKIKTNIPIFIIQGSIFRMLDNKTRNLEMLKSIINTETSLDYKIKIVVSSLDTAISYYQHYGFELTNENISDHPILSKYEKPENTEDLHILKLDIT